MRSHHGRGRRAAALLACSVASAIATLTPPVGAQTAAAALPKPKVTLIDTGAFPTRPAINTTTNKVYVANWGSDTVSVIDGRSNEVTATIPTSRVPTITLVNPRSNTIFVVTAAGLDVIDGDTNRVVRTVPKVTGRLAAINTTSNKVYVTASRGMLVKQYDPATDDVSEFPTGRSPSAIAINERTNRVYVTNAISDSVTVFDGDSQETSTIKTADHPVAVAVNQRTDKVYVANLGKRSDRLPIGRTLTVIDGRTDVAKPVYVDVAPVALAIDSTRNRVYVLSQSTMALTVLDARRDKVIGSVTAVGLGGIAVDEEANRIYVGSSPLAVVVDGGTLRKARFDAGGRMSSSAVVNPVTGRAYLNNPASSNIAVMDAPS